VGRAVWGIEFAAYGELVKQPEALLGGSIALVSVAKGESLIVLPEFPNREPAAPFWFPPQDKESLDSAGYSRRSIQLSRASSSSKTKRFR